ncbi:WEB family protein At5g16730, chloroplastic-like [Tasmannia lanceolata]|uniref:WEB family protein At5g16730, chloroplastic-like n=1 Tax=Tasmannia lanceolata TaxID=3420 RepID=UPI004064A16D
MLSSKTKTGLSETIPNKTSPATPRVSKLAKGTAKSESNSPSPLQNPRLSIDRSPRSVDSKPAVDRRSPKISTPPDKRVVKGSELQAQLDLVQEDLKKTKEQLTSVQKEKAKVFEELREAKRLADEANEKLNEAMVAQKRAEESSEIEKFRADELEQAGIEANQKREEEWQKEIEAIRSQHAVDVTALLSTTQELQRIKHELSMTSDAKNAALSHADDAMKIAEINAEKVEFLSAELGLVRALLDSKMETINKEADELVKKLNSEVDSLKQELERAKMAEDKLGEMEGLIEELRIGVSEAKRAELEAGNLVDEWKEKAELLEVKVEELTQSERGASESLGSAMKELEGKNLLLQDAESKIVSLRGHVESLEISLEKHKGILEESDRKLETMKQEVMGMAITVENLKSELESLKEEKMRALDNEKLAISNVQNLLEEKNKFISDLEASRDEAEEGKKVVQSLQSALSEASTDARDAKEKLSTSQVELGNAVSQIEDLKLVLSSTEKKYKAMLDEAKEQIDHLKNTLEGCELEAKNAKAELGEKELDFEIAIKKSEEEIASVKREMDRVAKDSKDEWDEKELSFVNAIRKSEEENVTMKSEMDRLLSLIKETEEEKQTAKEKGVKLLNKLKQVESEVTFEKEVAEKAKAESSHLKEILLDKENELQSVTQENDDLRIREAKALGRVGELSKLLEQASAKRMEEDELSHLKELLLDKENELQSVTQENDDLRIREAKTLGKVDELSKLLEQASAKRMEENGELSNSEKDYDLLPKMEAFANGNGNGNDRELVSEFPVEQTVDHTEIEETVNGNAKEEDTVEVEVKMRDNCKISEKDLSPEREPEQESFDEESDSKIDSDSFDQINGSETIENGGSSPLKQQQKKKKALLRKFSSLLKKKSNPSN